MTRRIAMFAFISVSYAACSSFGTTPGNTSSGGGDDAAVVESGSDGSSPGPCDLDRPFGLPMPLTGETALWIETARPVNENVDDILSSACEGDLLTCDLHRSKRVELGTDAGKLTGLSATKREESFPFFHAASTRIFFGRGQVDAGPAAPRRIFVAPAASAVDAVQVTIMPSADSDAEPYIVGDALFFRRVVGAAGRIWSVKLDGNGTPLGEATEMALPFQGNLFAPVVSSDLKEIFLAVEGSPKFLLKAARREDVNSGFVDATTAFSALPAAPIAYPVWLSSDRCTLWVVTKTANRGSVQVFERPKR